MLRFMLCFLLISFITELHADWRQFRGNDGNSAVQESVPTTWSTEGENVAWQVDLPGRGPASPIVVQDKVIVTCSSGARQQILHVLCFSVKDGSKEWERKFWATGRTLSHQDSANAAPTPASDGNLIFAFYSSNDLVCLDLEGNLQWYRGLAHDFPKAGNDVGMSSSPIIADNTVIVQVENQGESFAAGIDIVDGTTRWQIPRKKFASWSSPVLLPTSENSESVVLLQNTSGLTAVKAYSGDVLWNYEAEASTIPSAIATKKMIYFPGQGTTALAVSNPEKTPTEKWFANKLSPSAGSAVMADDKLFAVNRAGALTCADASTGETLWALRLKGPFWASPVYAGGYLYCLNQSGSAFVVNTKGEEGEIVSTIDVGETLQATPAVANGALFIRSDKHLWKIASP